MTWRVAASILTLRDQVNAYAPGRNRASDGTIGDAAHAATTSDHNPWIRDAGLGVVSAIDITHDPRSGVDTFLLADRMREARDPRIKYVISNRRIFSSTNQPWVWRRYTGSSPHTSHIHLSVNSQKAHYDDARAWRIGWSAGEGEENGVRPTLRRGSRGEHVRELQRLLDIHQDGDFGPQTEHFVKQFQIHKELQPDGVVGPLTWAALDPAENPGATPGDDPILRPILRRGSFGPHVEQVQTVLALTVDGAFGPITEREVRMFQGTMHLNPDGVVGPLTWAALDKIEQIPRPLDFDTPKELSAPIIHTNQPPGPIDDAPDNDF